MATEQKTKWTPGPLQSIRDAIAFSSRDWSLDQRDAWVYGIVHGWDGALPKVAELHGWRESDVMRLASLHTEFAALAQAIGEGRE